MIIYKITNNVNKKIYIGQTIRTIEERISEHRRHKETIMGRAFRKYGFDNFSIEVIDIAESMEELNEKETFYIKKFNSLHPNGYNLCYGGNNTKGYRHKEESKLKMSLNRGRYFGEDNPFFNRKHTIETRNKMKEKFKDNEFYQKRCEHLDKVRSIKTRKILNVTTGEKFDSIKEACEKYGIKDGTHISRVCRGKRKSCFGFVFKYID